MEDIKILKKKNSWPCGFTVGDSGGRPCAYYYYLKFLKIIRCANGNIIRCATGAMVSFARQKLNVSMWLGLTWDTPDAIISFARKKWGILEYFQIILWATGAMINFARYKFNISGYIGMIWGVLME